MWTDEEIEFLKTNYPEIGKYKCCELLSKTEGSVRHQAAKHGLRLNTKSEFFIEFQKRAASSKVGKKRPFHGAHIKMLMAEGRYVNFLTADDKRRKEISERTKKYIKENGHPKGFLGKHRTKKEKQDISKHFKAMWKNKDSVVNSDAHRKKLSDRFSANMQKRSGENVYSKAKKGWVEIGTNKHFYRSSWEANIAAYLEFLKDKKEIKEWDYECDVYWFHEIKRGVRSYKPDFKVFRNDGTFYYEEVKGWMDDKSKTKLNRMRIYYPSIDVRILDEKRYKEICKFKSIIKHWGALD